MVSVVICEKNNAAQRVAAILSKGNYQKTYVNKVPVLRFPWNGGECAVVGMRGHILNFDYPKEYSEIINQLFCSILPDFCMIEETDPFDIP